VKILFDTSALVAGVVEAHPAHERAHDWLSRALNKRFRFLVAAHSLAELFAVLSTLPVSPRISGATAWRLIRENVIEHAEIIALSKRDYTRVLSEMAGRGLSGGAVYDALIACAAERAAVDRLLTLNPAHFRRIWPQYAERVFTP